MAYDTSHLLTVGHAKAVHDSLKSAIDDIADLDKRSTVLDDIDWTTGKCILYDDGTLYDSATLKCTDYIDVTGSTQIVYKRCVLTSSTARFGLAFYDSSKAFISGSGQRCVLDAAAVSYELTTIDVPASAKYVRTTAFVSDSYGTFSIAVARSYPLKDTVDELSEKVGDLTVETTAPQSFWEVGSYNYPNGANYSSTTRIRITGFVGRSTGILRVRALTGYEFSVYAWNASSGAYVGAYMTIGTIATSGTLKWVTEFDFSAYPDYVFKLAMRNATAPTSDMAVTAYSNCLFTRYREDLQSELSALGLHVVPDNQGQLNCVKRARQLTEAAWVSPVDLPRCCQVIAGTHETYGMYEDVFKAGVEYKGIPYSNTVASNAGYGQKYIGYGVSLDTFITAMCNDNSVIAEESFYAGSTYPHSTIYGHVCSSFVSYAWGLSTPKDTSTIGDVTAVSNLGKINNNGTLFDLNRLKLGDALNYSGHHIVLVTDIVRDVSNVVWVEISEATTVGNGNQSKLGTQFGGITRRKGFSAADLLVYFENYSVLRYSGIVNATYTPSKYVRIGNELDTLSYLYLPCMPYMGDGAVYKSADLRGTDILIECPDYGFLRVFKDDVEITGSPFTLTSSTESVDTGFSATGSYEAYLCDMAEGENTKRTISCHWTVV